MDKVTLFGLVEASNEIMLKLAETGGELPPELESQLATVELNLPAKIDSYAHLIERLGMEKQYWAEKSREYLKLANSCGNLQDRLKDNIKLAMDSLGKKEVEGNDVRFKIQNASPSVEINNIEIVEDAYKTTHTVVTPNKRKIAEDLKLGVPVAGASLIENTYVRAYPNKKV